ncbi:MAG: gliding motility protein GldC [Chlorobi bacterium]|nr:gliding motility protein GldC [Chlorobiota bacterium]
MAVKHRSKIILEVGLDENRIPEEITWTATDAGIENRPAEAFLLSVWDDERKEALRLDLWTKEMKVYEMQFFIWQTIRSLADTYRKATGDDRMADTILDLADYMEEKLELRKGPQNR